MRALLAVAALSCPFVLAAPTRAAPTLLFDKVLTADGAAPAPAFADPALICDTCSQGGGLLSGPVSVTTPGVGTLTVSVTDLGRVGDVFQVLLDGDAVGLTSPATIDGPTNSAGSFSALVPGGFHAIDVWDFVLAYVGQTGPYGGTVPFDFTSTDLRLAVTFDAAQSVPEPASLGLLSAAVATGAVAAARRRRGRSGSIAVT